MTHQWLWVYDSLSSSHGLSLALCQRIDMIGDILNDLPPSFLAFTCETSFQWATDAMNTTWFWVTRVKSWIWLRFCDFDTAISAWNWVFYYRINRRRYLSSRDHTCKFAQHHFELNNIRVCIPFRRSILPLLNIPTKLCQINQLNETF